MSRLEKLEDVPLSIAWYNRSSLRASKITWIDLVNLFSSVRMFFCTYIQKEKIMIFLFSIKRWNRTYWNWYPPACLKRFVHWIPDWFTKKVLITMFNNSSKIHVIPIIHQIRKLKIIITVIKKEKYNLQAQVIKGNHKLSHILLHLLGIRSFNGRYFLLVGIEYFDVLDLLWDSISILPLSI